MMVIEVADQDLSCRADVLLAAKIPELSRSFLKKLAAQGRLTFNETTIKSGYRLRQTGQLKLDYDPKDLAAIPTVKLEIIYEDDSVLVINKPSGLITHARGRYWNEASVASSIRRYQATQDDSLRAGIVHRLDRGTSGLLVCAKDSQSLANLQTQFRLQTVTKEYEAIVTGQLPPKGLIDKPIGRNHRRPTTFCLTPNGRAAQTEFEIQASRGEYTQLKLIPKTGRTHQLRLHLASLSAPIVGDELYGGQKADRLLLHAKSLSFNQPQTDKRLSFVAPSPSIFKDYV